MRIAIDAMGGDHAPREIVNGSLDFVSETGVTVVLVGREDELRPILEAYPGWAAVKSSVEVVNASDVIEMGEHPATAVRKKKDSSIVVAARLVKDNNCHAMVSAGNTGAAMAASLFAYGRISGIDRPAIASPMPTLNGMSLILDAGANADVKPKNLLQFGMMGSIYMERVINRDRPKVGLLNIGEEETKGNELVLAAYPLLVQSSLNFIGNIEGRDVSAGAADVIVCDGFVGNVILKFAEGMGSALFTLIKREAMKGFSRKAGALLMKPAFRSVAKVMDYAEYGGAPLLGLNGLTIISHGSSKAKAIKNAIAAAVKSVDGHVVEAIADSVGKLEEGREVD